MSEEHMKSSHSASLRSIIECLFQFSIHIYFCCSRLNSHHKTISCSNWQCHHLFVVSRISIVDIQICSWKSERICRSIVLICVSKWSSPISRCRRQIYSTAKCDWKRILCQICIHIHISVRYCTSFSSKCSEIQCSRYTSIVASNIIKNIILELPPRKQSICWRSERRRDWISLHNNHCAKQLCNNQYCAK